MVGAARAKMMEVRLVEDETTSGSDHPSAGDFEPSSNMEQSSPSDVEQEWDLSAKKRMMKLRLIRLKIHSAPALDSPLGSSIMLRRLQMEMEEAASGPGPGLPPPGNSQTYLV